MTEKGEDHRARLAGACLVVALTVLVLFPTLRAPFMYDDTEMIRDNAWLRGWSALFHVWGQPYWPSDGPDTLGLYRPVHVAALATVWNLSGGSALAFHAYALILAVATSLAVWWLLRRGAAAAAMPIAAIIFAVHPLHVEAVASAANTSELLVVLGTIALVALLRPEQRGEAAPSWQRALLVALVAAATLLSKESGLLALPLALITVWGWRMSDEPVTSMRALMQHQRRAIGAAAVALFAALLARAAVLDAAVSRTSIAAQGLDMDWPQRVVAMVSLWPRIAGMLVWPTSLAPYYGPSSFPARTALYAAAGLLAVLVLLALAVRQSRRGDRRPLVALAWIGLTYFPASNLLVPTGQILSDRTLFGATVGVALGLAWLTERAAFPTLAGRVSATLALGAVVLGYYALESRDYVRTWTSHRALWTHLVRTSPEEHLGYKLLGMEARARGEHERAIALLQRGAAMAPSDRQIRFELGQSLYQSQRFEEAATTLAMLARDGDAQREPGFVAMYLDAVGRSRGADAVLEAARPLAPTSLAATLAVALYSGMAHERMGRREAAHCVYQEGLRSSPEDSTLRARMEATADPMKRGIRRRRRGDTVFECPR